MWFCSCFNFFCLYFHVTLIVESCVFFQYPFLTTFIYYTGTWPSKCIINKILVLVLVHVLSIIFLGWQYDILCSIFWICGSPLISSTFLDILILPCTFFLLLLPLKHWIMIGLGLLSIIALVLLLLLFIVMLIMLLFLMVSLVL